MRYTYVCISFKQINSFAILPQAKMCTIEKVLTTLQLTFTCEETLSQHGKRLASQLAKLLTHSHSAQGVSSNGERDGRSALEKL